jgi:hypothetical protein
MPDERARRLAANEARFREINERVERDLEGLVDQRDELLPFVCECGSGECSDTIGMTIPEYERVRSDPLLFAVVPGHEIEDVEDVLARHERYFVVRKHAETHEIAEETDPRR